MTASNEQAARAPGLFVEVLDQFEVPTPDADILALSEAHGAKVVLEAPLGENRLLRVLRRPE